MSDRDTRALANELARLRRRLDRFETNQQSWARSVEEAALDFYDENDLLRLSVGRQDDGSYGIRYPEGEPPPKPSEPDVVTVADGLVVVTWDGRFEERFSAGEFRNLRVHIDEGDPAFVPTRSNQVGAIWTRRGGSIVAVTDSDVDNPVYVKFVATNQAGQWSPESDAVLVDETDEDDIGDDDEELEWEADDFYVLTAADVAAGVATFPLTYLPEAESILAVWAGVPQRPTNYTVDYNSQEVTWPLSGFEKAGHKIWVHYAHREGAPGAAAGTVLVDWASGGWKYKQFAIDDSVNRSAVAFDDTSWAVGTAPFGDEPSNHPYPDPFGATTTTWADETSLWVRRQFTVPPGLTSVTLSLRIDNLADVYVDGALVGSRGPTNMSNPNVADITVALAEGVRTVAVRAQDSVGGGSSDATYFDMQIRAEAP